MKQGGRLILAAALAAVVGFGIACQNGVTGPSLTATITAIDLAPTLNVPGDTNAGRNICCCHVVGTVKNTSSIEVHIQLQFPTTQNGQAVGTAVALLKNIPSGSSRTFDAPGIQAACNTVSLQQIQASQRVRVLGLWEPTD